MMAMAASEGERRYASTRRLLGFSLAAPRLVVSTIETSGQYAVAYVHVPNRIETLKEIFLINEDGEWKIRRFMGERDNPTVIGALAEEKRFADEPLDADEQMYLDDPHTYQERRLVRLYEESGIAAPVRD
jgi:hypothetical protein